MANIERKAVLTLQQGEWPDNLTHGIWRAECMVQWLKDAGIALVDADLHQGAVAALRRIAAIEVEHTIIQTLAEARLKNAVAIAKSALSNSGGQ